MNILFTCAGRRNYLVKFFQDALAGSGLVIACDNRLDAPAMQIADRAFQVPLVDSPEYWTVIEEICRKNEVRLLFSLNDLELPFLARQTKHFRSFGTIPVVASEAIIDTCFDKLATARFLSENNFRVPRTFVDPKQALAEIALGRLSFPLILKPRWGSASISIEIVDNEEELGMVHALILSRLKRSILASVSDQSEDQAVLIQEKALGQEYHLDIVNDLDGNHVATLAKMKLAMRAGETDKAISVDNPILSEVGRRLGELTRHPGVMDCDVFLEGEDVTVLEMNPRFGGGYPFSQLAGANIPSALIAWARGKEPDPTWLGVTAGVTVVKCDELVVTR